jgi:hypothetical protein
MKFFFIATDPPYKGFGGANIINWSFISFLLEKKHEVYLFVDPPREDFENEYDKKIIDMLFESTKKMGCEVISININRKKIIKKNLFQKLFSFNFEDFFPTCYYSEEIYEIINKKYLEIKPDILVCFGAPAIHWVNKIKAKKIAFSHDIERISYAHLKISQLLSIKFFKNIIIYLRSRIFFKKMIKEFNQIDLPFAFSNDFRKNQLKFGQKKCKHFLPPYYDPQKENKFYFKKKNNKFKILLVGLMSTVNRTQLNLLENKVLPYLEKNYDVNQIELHLIGIKKEKLTNNLKKKNYIFARGFVEDYHSELFSCDLFYCYTPLELGFRTRLLDALALGKPIITSELDAVSFPFLKNDHNCYIIKNNNNVGKKIIEIILNSEQNKIIGKNARKSFLENCTFETAGEKLEKEIIKLINY